MVAIGRDHLFRWEKSECCATRIYKPNLKATRLKRMDEIERESKLAMYATSCEFTVFMEEC